MGRLGWFDILMALGTPGVLIVILTLVMLVVFVRRLIARRMCWKLLWFGGVSAAMGVLGTVLDRMAAFSTIAEMGGAAGPGDLARALAKSHIPGVCGFGSLLLTLVCVAVLHHRAVPQPAEESPAARPPR